MLIYPNRFWRGAHSRRRLITNTSTSNLGTGGGLAKGEEKGERAKRRGFRLIESISYIK